MKRVRRRKSRRRGSQPADEVAKILAAADALLLPTRAEGIANVWVEALACGTPVVGTPVGAIPEVLRPLDPELLFAGTSTGEMAEWLSRRLPDMLANSALREQCRTYAVRHYAWDSIMLQIELLFYEAAGASFGEPPVPAGSRLGHPISEL